MGFHTGHGLAVRPAGTPVPDAVKLLTLARDLQRRKARERHQLFVAEGVRTVEALLASSLHVKGMLVAESFGEAADAGDAAHEATREHALLALAHERGIPVAVISEKDLRGAADTDSPQGVLAIAGIPSRSIGAADTLDVLAPARGDRFVVLDALQDPGNVGTVVRTAAALGVRATFALPGTVDVWNAKVVRGSMGTLFTHPVFQLDWAAVQGYLHERGATVWAADMHGDVLSTLSLSTETAPMALVVSNEGAGLSPQLASSAHRTVSIPMAPDVESLNVGVAAGILLYAMQYRPVA